MAEDVTFNVLLEGYSAKGPNNICFKATELDIPLGVGCVTDGNRHFDYLGVTDFASVIPLTGISRSVTKAVCSPLDDLEGIMIADDRFEQGVRAIYTRDGRIFVWDRVAGYV